MGYARKVFWFFQRSYSIYSRLALVFLHVSCVVRFDLVRVIGRPCLYLCIHPYMQAFLHVYMSVSTRTLLVHVGINAHIHTPVHPRMYLFIPTYIQIYMWMCIYTRKATQYGPQFLSIPFSGVFHVLGKRTPHSIYTLALRVTVCSA